MDTTRSVDAAMAATPRAHFLPDQFKRSADVDTAIPIGGGSTCSQPTTVRNMLLLLDVHPSHRVLDVGSGSGWTTAILAKLTGEDGDVTGVELLPEMVSRSREALRTLDVPNARILQAERGILGHPDGAPYDRILFSANAERGIPTALISQLGDGGILVGPVDGVMTVVRKTSEPHENSADAAPDRLEISEHGLYRFVPLIEDSN